MGTRALIVMIDTAEDLEPIEIAVLYSQWDGYIQGLGLDLATFLSGFKITRGLSRDNDTLDIEPNTANGMPCLAGQIISHFKAGAGSYYLYPATYRNLGEEYIYTVEARPGSLSIKIEELKYKSLGDTSWYTMVKDTPQRVVEFIKDHSR